MATKPRPQSFVAAIASGDRRTALTALRDKLAAEVELVDPRYLAPLARQLTDVLKALDAMPSERESVVDELSKRRASRRGAEVEDSADGAVVRGNGGRRTS